MEVYLTEDELSREENLFKPHEVSCAPLTGRTDDIRALSEEMDESDEMAGIPPSC